ncbi:MAG: NF038129 family PEP-CTERM protein [Chthoniobacteraceae bacterium]
MKNTVQPKFITASLIAVAGFILSTAATEAALYHIDINTAALNLPANSGDAPFSLDFQFNDGGVLGNNTATITNFTFGGGSATGSPTLFDGALGNIGSTVTLNNSGPFQELYQTFTPGAVLGFDVSLTQNLDGLTPDSFVVAILDKNPFNIPTTGIGDSLLHADIDTTSPLTIAQLNLSSGTGSYAGVTVSAIPEPGTALWGAAFGLIAGVRRIRNRKAA